MSLGVLSLGKMGPVDSKKDLKVSSVNVRGVGCMSDTEIYST